MILLVLQPIFRNTDLLTGNTALCNLTGRALPRGHTTSRSSRRKTLRTSEFLTSDQLYLRRYVDACHHAIARWLHDRGRIKQVQYC